MHLIITRPIVDAMALAGKLEALGHKISLAPLLEIKPYGEIKIPPKPYQAVVLTSANAVRALERHEAGDSIKSMRVFVVGPQSFQAALLAGFKRIEKGGGEGKSLATYLSSRLAPKDGPILYLSGYDTAGNIAGALGKNGFAVERIAIYRAEAARQLPPHAQHAIREGAVDGVLLYSQRTAKVWTKCVAAGGLQPYMGTIVHFCLSAGIGGVLPHGVKLEIAESADEPSMFELLAAVTRKRSKRASP